MVFEAKIYFYNLSDKRECGENIRNVYKYMLHILKFSLWLSVWVLALVVGSSTKVIFLL